MLNANLFDAPIAGSSLTTELGSVPWQQPAQIPTIKGVISFYSEKISEPKAAAEAVSILNSGVPIRDLTNATITAGVMEGIHSLDTGFMAMPVVSKMYTYLAEEAGIDYTTGIEKDDSVERLNQSTINEITKEFEQKVVPTESEPDPEPIMEEEPRGFAKRRTVV